MQTLTSPALKTPVRSPAIINIIANPHNASTNSLPSLNVSPNLSVGEPTNNLAGGSASRHQHPLGDQISNLNNKVKKYHVYFIV